jgi:hypothetical protein
VARNVKGILFADYVRMIRSHKAIDWAQHLPSEDWTHLAARIDPAGWYPMAAFERLGNAILAQIANRDMQAVRMWGRLSADALQAANQMLVAPQDPIETLMRFRVLRASYFDFEALEVLMLVDGQAEVAIAYHMGATAEEAASWQTLGFFERMVELAGAVQVDARFTTRAWAGDARTLLALAWRAA